MTTTVYGPTSTYAQALSCAVSAPAVLQNDLQHGTLAYRPGQKIERSPFFTLYVVPKTIQPLQTASGVAVVDSSASYGILQWVELKNALNPVATKPVFTGEGMHVQLITTVPGTILNTNTDGQSFDLYLAAFIQDPNSCVRGSNSFTVPEDSTYIQAAYVDSSVPTNNTITFKYPGQSFTVNLTENENLFLVNASTQTAAYNTGTFIINIKGISQAFPDPPTTAPVTIKLTLNLLSNKDILAYTAACSEMLSMGV